MLDAQHDAKKTNACAMEIRQLEAFAAVMTTGSVTGAARLLERSQPAITRLALQELEAEIGYAACAQRSRVTPTEQAYLLYGDVGMLGSWRSIHSRAAGVGRGGVAQPLVLAATSALAVGLVPQALHALQESFADTPLQLRSAAPEQVVRTVNGVVQMGASSLPLDHKGLRILWMGQAPCVAVLPCGDALCDLPVVPLHALAQRRLVTMSNPYRLRHKPNAALSTNVGMGAQASGTWAQQSRPTPPSTRKPWFAQAWGRNTGAADCPRSARRGRGGAPP